MATVAEILAPTIGELLGGEAPLQIRCWDGSGLGPPSRTALIVRSPRALRRLLYQPNELGLGRAYVAGEIDIDGDVFDVFALRDLLVDGGPEVRLSFGRRGRLRLLSAARKLGALGLPLPPPPEEARLRGRKHSKARDATAIAHHYNLGYDFYRLFLGDTMTYSCGYFEEPDSSLDDAQRAKYELVCRKLGLRAGMRLLDVGCGWGGMAIHAAQHHGVTAVGITLSQPQAELASKRVADMGFAGSVEIRVQDYRDVEDGPYDAISSIGMFEHVGLAMLGRYFDALLRLLRPGGRLLNHAISRPSGKPGIDPHSFIGRYVFPDGELQEVGTVVTAMQERGLEVRDVHSLREHYALTLRHWVANLEAKWEEAERIAGEARARVWRLYMAGSAVNFEAGRTSVHQVLAVRPHPSGTSDLPLVRKW